MGYRKMDCEKRKDKEKYYFRVTAAAAPTPLVAATANASHHLVNSVRQSCVVIKDKLAC